MTITMRQLRSLGACQEQLILFEQTFGSEIEITKKVVIEHGHKFDITWIAENILTSSQLETYEKAKAPLLETYEKAKATLRETYEKEEALLWETYKKEDAPLWETYEKEKDTLWETYEKERAPLWKTYEKERAPLWETHFKEIALAFWNIVKDGK